MRKDAEILGQFDGRGRVEVVLRAAEATRAGIARGTSIAHEPGYALRAREQGGYTLHLTFVRDDDPLARRRAEETRARAAAGGPVLLPRVPGGLPRPRPLGRLRRCPRTSATAARTAGERRSHPYARPCGRRGWLR